LALCVWCWYFGFPDPPEKYKSLPYTCQSPYSYKSKTFETKKDIWDEIDLLCEENTKFTDGQNLYHMIPLFASAEMIIEDWMMTRIQEYSYTTRFNVSLGELNNVSADMLDCFAIIDKEIQSCKKYEMNKNG